MCSVAVRIAVVGDYQPDHETHPATTAAVHHAVQYLAVATEVSWVATDDAVSLAACNVARRHPAIKTSEAGHQPGTKAMSAPNDDGDFLRISAHWPVINGSLG